SKPGHIAMMLHFLAVGLVFFWPIMGVAPQRLRRPRPHRPAYGSRTPRTPRGGPPGYPGARRPTHLPRKSRGNGCIQGGPHRI
ncbi:cytochrome c oxidase assembly protein, partial [Streptomyces zhihengii]